MSKEQLKNLRILIPGIIILILVIPIFQSNYDVVQYFTTWDGLLGTLLAIILGAIYHISNLRGRFLKKSLEQIHQNIKEKLLEPFPRNKLIMQSQIKLHDGRKLINVFYNLIDNSETLKEKAKNVHQNGLFWTTIADLSALTLISSILYFIFGFTTNRPDFIIIATIILIISLFCSIVLMPLITKKHIELGNEQLEFIQIHLKKELLALLTQVIKS